MNPSINFSLPPTGRLCSIARQECYGLRTFNKTNTGMPLASLVQVQVVTSGYKHSPDYLRLPETMKIPFEIYAQGLCQKRLFSDNHELE